MQGAKVEADIRYMQISTDMLRSLRRISDARPRQCHNAQVANRPDYAGLSQSTSIKNYPKSIYGLQTFRVKKGEIGIL